MAYTITSRAATRITLNGTRSFPQRWAGVVALVGGTKTVAVPNSRRIVAAFVSAQSSNATYVSATATSTSGGNASFVITGTSTDVVMWEAIVE